VNTESKIYDLDLISLSLEIFTAWKYHVAKKVVEWYRDSGRLKNINPSEIPDEQFRVYENGDGEIFIMMPDNVEISLPVPKGHWGWSKTLNN